MRIFDLKYLIVRIIEEAKNHSKLVDEYHKYSMFDHYTLEQEEKMADLHRRLNASVKAMDEAKKAILEEFLRLSAIAEAPEMNGHTLLAELKEWIAEHE